MNDKEIGAIVKAFQFWKSESKGINFMLSIENLNQDKISQDKNDIFFLINDNSSKEEITTLAKFNKITGRSTIYLFRNNLDDDIALNTIFIHELGHYFGISHSKNYESFMFPILNGKVKVLFYEDKVQFCNNICCY
jgi:hypothetical protein